MKASLTLTATICKSLGCIWLLILICSCNQPSRQADIAKKAEVDSLAKLNIGHVDYKIINTTKLITTIATEQYQTKNRKSTQFALDKHSTKESEEAYNIKISNERVLICDLGNHTLLNLTIVKQWVDKSGPSTVYDLKDSNGIEYSLDHYVDTNKKHFLSLRFSNKLETYTDEHD